ncbi:UNVERIFIED_CONTAM: putative esterase KAI2 [Sesamum latifolium]|uniref:Esterase KAI2 n=1 Tax=Sesamum latifolium TaxID=2727402 RepID=A0AAW2XFJ5_9LAMI
MEYEDLAIHSDNILKWEVNAIQPMAWGSFSYKLPADDMLKDSDAAGNNINSSRNCIMASTLLGSIIIFIPMTREEYELLEDVQARLVVDPLTAPILGNDHNEFRSRESRAGTPKILDGDILAQFLELTSMQQEAILALPLGTPKTAILSMKPSMPAKNTVDRQTLSDPVLDMEAFGGCGGVVKSLNTHIYGNGSETIVLSHGYGSNQGVWHFLIPALAYYFKVLVYDLVISPNVNPKLYDPLRYSNFSGYAQDLTCILDELNVRNSVFVGHSMSAMIGCIAAKQRPDLFQHLVLLAGSPRYLNDTGYDGGFSKVELDSLFGSIQSDFSGWVKSFVPKAIGVNDRAAIAEFEGSLGRLKPETALSAARSVFLTDNRNVLPHVHVPTTIIQSEKDIIVPESVAFYMKRRVGVGAAAKAIILKTQGHFPQLTVPNLLFRVLKQTLGIQG